MTNAAEETPPPADAKEIADLLLITLHEPFTAVPRYDAEAVTFGKTYYNVARGEMMGEIGVILHWEMPSGTEGKNTYPFVVPASEIQKLAQEGPWGWRKQFAEFASQMEARKDDAVTAEAAARATGVSTDSIIVAPSAATFRRKGPANGP